MATLLQTLLTRTLPSDIDPILYTYIDRVLPTIEQEFGLISALGGSEEVYYHLLAERNKFAGEEVTRRTSDSEQSLLVCILNGLLIVWNLLPFLGSAFLLSDDEKRILCLGLTLHCHDTWMYGEEEDKPKSSEIGEILERCRTTGERLSFVEFWADWREYLAEIAYLAHNEPPNVEVAAIPENWASFKITDPLRLELPLRHLLLIGNTAVQLNNPVDIMLSANGRSLQKRLQVLGIQHKLVYHRVRDSIGLLTTSIHNSVIHFVKDLNWQPILVFSQGIVYLAPQDVEPPNRSELQDFIWEQINIQLSSSLLRGKVGFKRDGKGLKVAPQMLEMFSPTQLIRNLPRIVKLYVRNDKDPATPKRLKKLEELSAAEREFLASGANLRADRLAEFIILVQKELFGNRPEFIAWMLKELDIESGITPEQTQMQSGVVNFGWYHAAAYYVTKNPTLNFSERLQDLAEKLATWIEDNELLPAHHSPTREILYDYLTQYLEVQGWDLQSSSFSKELAGYVNAKTKAAKQPICSLSSGEFPSEDQTDSVVLFKPQQYSNKNPLGGRQIKRGISKIWSLEMLLRQAIWSVPAGKLEERQPVFLHIFPAYLYAPQMAAAIQLLLKDIKHLNLWQVCQYWLDNGMDAQELRSFPWLNPASNGDSPTEPGQSEEALPFIAISHTTTSGKTITDAWVEPIFWALTLPMLLGIKIVVTSSSVLPHNSGSDFQESVKLDGPADFWYLLQLPTSLHLQDWIDGRVQNLAEILNRLMVVYSLHLESRSKPKDARWRALNGTVREITDDILNIFLLAEEGLRRDDSKRVPTEQEIQQYWQYAQIWAEGNENMQAKLKITKQLVSECRKFYRASPYESSHTILLPLSKALEHILSVPTDWDDEEIIDQGAGQLHAALDRQEIYKRPLMVDKSVPHEIRQLQEIEAVQIFMTTCVKQLLGEMCKGDRALLQENRNRIKSGVELAYRQLVLQEKQTKAKKQEDES